MSARCLMLVAAAAALYAQNAPEPATVSGAVTNAVTGEPILRAHVTVRCSQSDDQMAMFVPQQAYGALTNEKGEFTISHLAPGDCWTQVERTGFVSDAPTAQLKLKSGDRESGVKLKLTPTGAIAGIVSNAAGEPMQMAQVWAESPANNFHAFTDDKGQFRVGGLRPGKYRVKARSESLPFPPEIRADGSRELRNATTYYPGTMDAKTAQFVEVKAGAEVAGIDIKMVQTPVVGVKGTVSGLPPGVKDVSVNASVGGIGGSMGGGGMGGGVKPDGTFVIWRLDPGKYTLRARHWGNPNLMSPPVDIEVTTSDLEHVDVRIVPPFAISGQLRYDDDAARQPPKPPTRPDGTSAPAPPPQALRLQFGNQLRQDGQQFSALTGADDTFSVDKVQPDRYHLTLNWGSVYVKSVRAGETETDGNVIDLRNGSPGPVTITLSSNFCVLSGTVSNSQGPVSEMTVALVPEEDPARPQMYRSDKQGGYRFEVPPGKYRIAVLTKSMQQWGPDGPDLSDANPESIELHAGDKIAKDLTIRQ